jgi:hypothetical protein
MWGLSAIRVKFQVAAANVLKLVELARLSHVDFRSGIGTVFQGVRRVFTLSRDRWVARAKSTLFALTPKVEHEMADLLHTSNSVFISA